MEIKYRMGAPDDAHQIAELLHLSSGGLSDFLLHDILPNCEILDLIALGVTDKSATISYTKTLVAENNGNIQGILNFYPVEEHKIPDIMQAFIPMDRIEHISPLFFPRVPDSLYLHALAVKQYASTSIGRILILKVIDYAKSLGIKKLSAHVFANNSKVLKVLLRKGFEIFDKITFADNPLLPDRKEMFLLSYEVG